MSKRRETPTLVTRMTSNIRARTTSTDPFIRDGQARIHGRNVRPDTEMTVTTIRGRVRFVALVTNPKTGAQWIDVIDSRGLLRAAAVDAVTTVHRIVKTRANGHRG